MTGISAAAPGAVRLNTATVTQYLTSQSSLAASLTGGSGARRRVVLLRSVPQWDGPAEPAWGDGRTAGVAVAPSPLAVHALVLDHLAGRRHGPPSSSSSPTASSTNSTRRSSPGPTSNASTPSTAGTSYGKRSAPGRSTRVSKTSTGPPKPCSTPPHPAAGHPYPAAGCPGSTPSPPSPSAACGSAATTRRTAPAAPATTGSTRRRYCTGRPRPGAPERLLGPRGPERAGLTAFLGEEDQAGLADAPCSPSSPPDAARTPPPSDSSARPSGSTPTPLPRRTWPAAAPTLLRRPAPGGRRTARRARDRLRPVRREYVTTLLAAGHRVGGDADADPAREARRTTGTVLDRAAVLTRQFGAGPPPRQPRPARGPRRPVHRRRHGALAAGDTRRWRTPSGA